MSPVQATIAYLRACQKARAAGYPVYLTTDPTWLVEVACARRAGRVEDDHAYGVCRPTKDGKIPRRATGDAQRHLMQLARVINTPRTVVRPTELGEWKSYLLRHIPERFET